jgi:D-lactate dehydrogenase (cytochrome)
MRFSAGKCRYLEKELGAGTMDVLRRIKKTLDPLSIMNPGKLLPPE